MDNQTRAVRPRRTADGRACDYQAADRFTAIARLRESHYLRKYTTHV